ncbi:MAG: extracellular solute-binding protein [Candidatus Eremiobacteraeota bacterium]|nr:extracellular solute-binding protein [Candidatus Eremiobacteraeota bacterium]
MAAASASAESRGVPALATTRGRFVGGALAAGALGVPALAEDEVAKLYEAAKKEGSVAWYTSPYPQTTAEALRDAFQKKYPGVTCLLFRQTAQVVFQRVNNDLAAGVHAADVVSTSEVSHFTKWKSQNVLAPYVPPDQRFTYRQFRTLDPDNTYHLGCFSLVAIDYAPKLRGSQPRKWLDLLDPKWKGQISLGHPGFSGFVANWTITMSDRYGWDAYCGKLAANEPKIGRSIFDVVTDVVAGERQVGCGVFELASQRKAEGNPIEIQWPDDGAVLIVSPFTVMKDAPHPNAARLLANFYYSKEFSAVCTQTFQYPMRADVPPPNNVPLDRLRWSTVRVEEQEAKTPEIIAKWRATFGV